MSWFRSVRGRLPGSRKHQIGYFSKPSLAHMFLVNYSSLFSKLSLKTQLANTGTFFFNYQLSMLCLVDEAVPQYYPIDTSPIANLHMAYLKNLFFYNSQVLFLFSFLIYLFLFSYNCLRFLPIPPPHPSQSHLPPPPLGFVLVSFIVAPIDPSPHYPLPTPLWLLLH